jgi:hypothetical protein
MCVQDIDLASVSAIFQLDFWIIREKLLKSANPCWNSKHILASMIYFLSNKESNIKHLNVQAMT